MMQQFFDPYSLRARIFPLWLVLFPLSLALYLWAPDALKGYTAGGSVVLAGALWAFGAQITRTAGRSREKALFASWDGPPTTRFLRHGNAELNEHTRRRYHKVLAARLPDLALPTEAEQEADCIVADRKYAACADYLRTQTRDPVKFAEVQRENIHYGFLRNLWGMKTIGVLATVLSLAATAYLLRVQGPTLAASAQRGVLVALALQVCILLFWIFWVRADKIKLAAEEYARRLLETCDRLDAPSPAQAKLP